MNSGRSGFRVRAVRLAAAAAVLGLLLACAAGNSVRLGYRVVGIEARAGDAELSLVAFKDGRGKKDIGVNSEGQAFYPDSSVAEWVGWSLYDELRAAGAKVKYHNLDTGFETDYVVGGEVLEVWVKQESATTYKAQVRAKVVVSRGGETVHIEKFQSEVERVVFPGSQRPAEVLTEALQGLVTEAARAVLAATR
ncbi:MAG: hypothetical protein PHV85_07780 [Desulfovibrionaceae bacterium]|nr:hypothetical protein [Desulfovibrionaceae bacterium]